MGKPREFVFSFYTNNIENCKNDVNKFYFGLFDLLLAEVHQKGIDKKMTDKYIKVKESKE